MTAAIHPTRWVRILVLALVIAAGALAAERKVHVFNAQAEAVWIAAWEVANDAFLVDKSSKAERKLRFRVGPLRAYRFEVVVINAGPRRTRVELELLTNLRGIQKDAWRNGDRYLTMIGQRLQRSGPK